MVCGRSYVYAANNNLVELTPPFRTPHSYFYNPGNLETEYRPPLLGALSLPTLRQHNVDRDPETITLPDGREIGYAYLANGVLDRVTTPEGDVAFTYDAVSGEIASIAAPSGLVTSYVRDGALLTDVIYSGLFSGSVHHEYDDDLNVIREDVNGGNSVAMAYDPDGLAIQVGALTLVPRTDNGELESTSIGVVSDVLGYTGFGEISTYAALASSTPLYSRVDERDDLGRIFRSTEVHGGVAVVLEYDYDLAGRLEEVRQGGVVEASYAYDGNDNRASVTDASGLRTATVDAQDRLLSFGAFTYTYNAAGQLETKVRVSTGELTTYNYDAQANLLGVEVLGGDSITYAVDGVGQRVGRWVNNVLDERYIWSSGSIVASIDSSAVLTRYVYATGGTAPDYFVRAGTSYRILKDPRGSVRLVVNTTSGAIAQRMDYGPFGEILTDTSPGFQPFGYAGGLSDPSTGLVRFGVRDYDPYAGRWTAKDPGGFQETGNLYAYVSNDPINLVDPSGQVGILGLLGGALMGGGMEVAMQLYSNGGRLSCIDWGEVGKEALIGGVTTAAGVGVVKLGAKFNKLRKLRKAAKVVDCLTCVAPETLVETINGPRPIQELERGDLVLAMDEATGDQAYKPIVEVHINPDRPLLELVLAHHDGHEERLRVTPDHPFWADGAGWVDAGDLAVEDEVYSLGSGWLRVAAMTVAQSQHVVYNLTVADYETFAVGTSEAWVHNCSTPWAGAAKKFTPDQRALVDLAKQAKKSGVDLDDARTLRSWADEYGISSRGPEMHPGRGFGAQPHLHLGPVNHIPVILP